MLSLIIFIALVGLIVWALTTYIPMPPAFRTAILVIAAVCLLFYVLNAFGVLHSLDFPLPRRR